MNLLKRTFTIILLLIPTLTFANEITYPMINSPICYESKEISKINGFPVDHVYNNIELWNRICRGAKSKEIIDSYLLTQYAEDQLKKFVVDQWAISSNNQPVDKIIVKKNYVEIFTSECKYKVINGTETQEMIFIFESKNIKKIENVFVYITLITICTVLIITLILIKNRRGNQ